MIAVKIDKSKNTAFTVEMDGYAKDISLELGNIVSGVIRTMMEKAPPCIKKPLSIDLIDSVIKGIEHGLANTEDIGIVHVETLKSRPSVDDDQLKEIFEKAFGEIFGV